MCFQEINPYWIEDNPTFDHKKWDTYPHKTKHYLPDSFNQTGSAVLFDAWAQSWKLSNVHLCKFNSIGSLLLASLCYGTQIFSQFLHKEYGGPGTLLVEPFTDMLVVLKEKRLAGAAPAARASLLWAQNHLDQDWQLWTSRPTR